LRAEFRLRAGLDAQAGAGAAPDSCVTSMTATLASRET
jgi:hypothetical protein